MTNLISKYGHIGSFLLCKLIIGERTTRVFDEKRILFHAGQDESFRRSNSLIKVIFYTKAMCLWFEPRLVMQ